MQSQTDTWIFGYGSLIWNPGFAPTEQVLARLHGYARSFCMWSIHHRGTEAAPGLVLALDAQNMSSCDGVAFRLPHEGHDDILAQLRERELVSSAYLEMPLPLMLRDGRQVQALCYVINRDHPQYTGQLDLTEQTRIIAGATGGRGPNCDYLYSTAKHLTELGIEDEMLTKLAQDVKASLTTR